MDSEGEALIHDLRTLGGPAVRELQRLLTADPEVLNNALRALVARPDLSNLAQLLALASTDEVARLRLLRAIRDACLGIAQGQTTIPSP